jgi:DNA-binding NarL/FixJ family response regulator
MISDSILIIDEDREFLAEAVDFLVVQMKLSNVLWAVTPEDAEEKVRLYNPRIVLLDLGMKKLRGEEIATVINKRAEAPVIVITCIDDQDDYMDLTYELGADGFFKKDRLKTAFPRLLEFLNSGHFAKDIFYKKSYLLN